MAGAASSSEAERFVLAVCQVEPFPCDPAASAAKLSAVIGRAREAVGEDRALVVLVPEVFLQHYGVFDPRKGGAADAACSPLGDPHIAAVAAAAKANRAAVVVTCALRQLREGKTAPGPGCDVVLPQLSCAAADAGDQPAEAGAVASPGSGGAGRAPTEVDEASLPFNAAVAIDGDGTIAAVYAKTHLWNGGGFEHVERDLYQACAEPRRAIGWDPASAEPRDGSVAASAEDVFPVFSLPAAGCGGLKFGMCICYDVEHPAVAAVYSERGADVLLVPTASTGPPAVLSGVLVPARAYEAHATVAYCNYPGRRPDGAPGPVPGGAVPLGWAAERPGCDWGSGYADDVGDGGARWPLGFSGGSVVYDGDARLAGAADPSDGEAVLLVPVRGPGSERVAGHVRRNPYAADRRHDLVGCSPLSGVP